MNLAGDLKKLLDTNFQGSVFCRHDPPQGANFRV